MSFLFCLCMTFAKKRQLTEWNYSSSTPLSEDLNSFPSDKWYNEKNNFKLVAASLVDIGVPRASLRESCIRYYAT